MPLTPADRALLDRCLAHQPGSWNDFVDRYLGLIYHVIRHTAHLRSVLLRPEDIEDLAAEILLPSPPTITPNCVTSAGRAAWPHT